MTKEAMQPTPRAILAIDTAPFADSLSLLAAVRAGHVFLSDFPDGPQMYLSSGAAMMGDQVARPADGKLTVKVNVTAHKFSGSAREKITAAGGSATEL